MFELFIVYIAGLLPFAVILNWLFKNFPPDPYLNREEERLDGRLAKALFIVLWPVVVMLLIGLFLSDLFVGEKR